MQESKKIRREKLILEKAKVLTKRDGFELISMKELAESCDLAVGTLYNYFPSKTSLLVKIIENDLNMILENGKNILHIINNDPIQWITLLLREHFRICDIEERDTLRKISNEIMKNRNMTIMKELIYKTMNSIKEQIQQLFIIQKESLLINEEFDISDISMIFFNLFYLSFRDYIFSDISSEIVFEKLSKQIRIVFTGIRRNV